MLKISWWVRVSVSVRVEATCLVYISWWARVRVRIEATCLLKIRSCIIIISADFLANLIGIRASTLEDIDRFSDPCSVA